MTKTPKALRSRGFLWWGWWDLNPLPLVHPWTEKDPKPPKIGTFEFWVLWLSMVKNTKVTPKTTPKEKARGRCEPTG